VCGGSRVRESDHRNWLYFRGLRISFQAEEAAMEAWWSVPSRDDHRQACLEAAARVEEGSWP
jgi:hypothetical protein